MWKDFKVKRSKVKVKRCDGRLAIIIIFYTYGIYF